MLGRLAGVVLGLAGALAVVPARGQPRPRVQGGESAAERRAVELHDEARVLYERGEYRAAIARLEAALELDPRGGELVYNLALIHEKLAEVDVAERYYRKYLEMETDPKVRERVNGILKRIEGAKKELADRRAAEAAAQAPPAPAGSEAPAPPPPAESGRRMGPWALVAGGVGVGAAMVGTVFAISAVASHPGEGATTGGGVSVKDLEDDAASAHARAVVADVAFIVSAVATGAALYLYLSSGPGPAAGSAAVTSGVSLEVGPRSGLVRVRF